MSGTFWLRIGALWGFLAVALGAFGAHGLQDRFRALGDLPGGLGTERLQASFHTAAQYHMYCSLALLVVGLLAVTGRASSALHVAAWSLLLGSVVFSGSLYILCVTGLRWLGAITPFGGVAILVGWFALALAAGSTATEPPTQLSR
jgi:uncharacterized membrane protein YgdD (TMEM256/DUF423 family)